MSEQRKKSFLFLFKEKRHENTTYFHMLIKYLREQGHICTIEDPTQYVSAELYNYFISLDNPFPLDCVEFLDNYDAIFYSNKPILFDVSGVKKPTFLIYDEIWKGLKIPKGTDFMITAEDGVRVLQDLDSGNYSKLKGIYDKLRGVIDPSIWKIREKKVPLAYMGMVFPSHKPNKLFQGLIWETKQRFIKHIQKTKEIAYNKGGYGYWDFVAEFPHVDKAIHFSNELNVGQGAWEALACGCILIEYPNNQGALEAGLGHGENCFLFNNEKELDEILEYIKNFPEETERIRARGIKLVQKHTYKALKPVEDFILGMLRK